MITYFKFQPVELLADGFSPAYPAVEDPYQEKMAQAHAALFNAQRSGDRNAAGLAALRLLECQGQCAAAVRSQSNSL